MDIGVNTLFMIPGEVGGTETYLRQTLLELAARLTDTETSRDGSSTLTRRDASTPFTGLVLFTNLENHAVLSADLASFKQVRCVRLNVRARNRVARIIREQVELPARVRASGVDVLWSPGYTAPRFCPCPQVVTIPDMQYKTHPQDLTRVARVVTDLLVRSAARHSRRLIAISEFSKGEIVKYPAAGREKVDVVPLAASQEFSNPLSLERRNQLLSSLLPSGKPFFLTVAASYPHKNLPALVRAFGSVINTLPHTLVMVGNEGLGEAEVRKALASLPDAARVIRLRKLSREALVALYQGCEAFVFPSLYEGFGLPVLEAMTAGVPVITTRYGSIPEVGGNGVVYFDPQVPGSLAASLVDVIGWSAADRHRKVQNARELAGRFSWAATATQTLDVFIKVVDPATALRRSGAGH
jgi:glycosyltransferase involved in cell wall biosynthesis